LHTALKSWLGDLRVCFRREQTWEYLQIYLLGLLADLKRKSIEPIALAAKVPVRTMQEFLSFFVWDHDRLDRMLMRRVADRPAPSFAGRCGGIAVIDATAHAKRGDKTPGVQRQYCGETGKIDNCVVVQHLLYTDDDAKNPFSCVVASDLFLPESWDADRERCREAGIPDSLHHRTKWRIAVDQVKAAVAAGVQFSWLVFDEDYGRIPQFWFELDTLGQRGVGEVSKDFRCWVKRPACATRQKCHASRRVDNLCRLSPAFTAQEWKPCRVKETGEVKYVMSNASEQATPEEIMRALFARWHVEKWFERAKQDAGLGAFEVRTYTSLIRHWLCSRIVMQFLSEQTARPAVGDGGEKSAHHVRAGGRGDEHVCGEVLEQQLALVR